MKYFLSIFFLVASFSIMAQQSKNKPKHPIKKQLTVIKPYIPSVEDSTLVNTVSLEICACMAPSLDSLHPAIVTMLEETLIKGDKIAQQNFEKTMRKMSPEDQKKLGENLEILDKLGTKDSGFTLCANKIDEKFNTIDFTKNKNKEKAFDKLLIYFTKKNCKTVGIFLALGNKKS
jgi:hypothetical protein